MKKLFVIVIMMALAMSAKAQDVYSVGCYNVNNGTIAALYKNDNRLYTAHYSNKTSKATRVTCNSQGDAFWLINFYDYPNGIYNHTEIRLNNRVYASNENHREVHIADMYCLNDTLYYAGYQYNEDSVLVATIWKGDDFATHRVLGDGIHASRIYDVDVDKRTGNPFFCGYVINEKQKAAVWDEQGLLYTFDQDDYYGEILDSEATEIAVSNSHIYTCGKLSSQDVPVPVIWKDNEVLLHGQPYFETLHSICTSGNDYYFCDGDRWGDNVRKNSQATMLFISYVPKLIATVRDIYVIGKDFDNKFYVWKNFEKQYQITNCNALYDMCVFDPFFEPHSEWYYEIQNNDGSTTYQHLEAEGDTTIHEKRPKIIIRSNTQYDRDTLFTEVTHEYVYEENGKVFWWNKELEEFTTLYDLAAETGDEWEIKVGLESFTVHVDSTGIFEYEGTSSKVIHISDAGNYFSGDIVVGYGHMTSFFPEKLMSRNGDFTVNGLRCYWVGDILVYHNGDEDCDAIYGEIHGVEEDGPSTPSTGSGTAGAFTVYPNPANGILTVSVRLQQWDSPTTGQTEYQISNLMGQTLLQGRISAETQQIDISTLPAGMYFISVGKQTMKFVVK